jgi:hypothetical protein
MIVNNKNTNNNKQFILGKGVVKKTNFVHSVHPVQLPEREVKNQRFSQVQPYIQHHNSDKIDNIQIKDRNTKWTKELNKTLHVNNKLYLAKLISGGEKSKLFPGGTPKLGGGFVKLS